MGPAEVTGLVIVLVAVIEGLMSLVKHLVTKNSEKTEDGKLDSILKELFIIKEKTVPRSWADMQEKMTDKLQTMTQTQLKILGIIERLERRMEVLPLKRD